MEENSLLHCNAMQFGDSSKFRQNISHPSSGSKSKPRKKPVEVTVLLKCHSLSELHAITIQMNVLFSHHHKNLKPNVILNWYFRPENDGLPCKGSDHRYRTCLAEQCGNVQRTTIRDFADQICIRAREVDKELLGTGLQKPSSDRELFT